MTMDLAPRRWLDDFSPASLERLPVAAYICAAHDGEILRANVRAVRLWGRTPAAEDRYSGALRMFMPSGALLPPEESPVARALRGLRPLLEDEVVIERPDGEHVTVSDQIELIQDDDGCVVAALVVQIDVTARKETEQALATSEARLQLALEVSDFGTYDWDVTTNLVVRSANAARMLGVRPDGPLATRDEFLMRVHPDDRKRVIQADRDALAGVRPFDMEFRVIRADGEVRWLIDRARVFRGRDGRPLRMIGARMDITERRRAELALRVSEERLEMALQAGRLGSWELNLHTRALTASAQCKANHGLQPGDDLPLDGVLAAVLDSHREDLAALIERTIASHGNFITEVPNRWPDGTDHWLLISGRVVDAASMVGVTHDVTERKRAEQQLAEMTRRKDLFIATLGHELRQPLTPMVTALALMRARADHDAVERARHVVERQVNQLTRLVDDLIDSARIAQGKVEMQCVPIDLRDAIADAVEVAAPLFEARRQQFQLAIPEVPMPMLADRSRLQQIFSNILVNATKYTDDHGVIALAVTATEYEARIVVRDNGRGIGADHLPWIFDMFMQASSETGLGIGLPVVRRLVEMHGGQVEARSDGAGRGSEFVVTLPLAAAGSAV